MNTSLRKKLIFVGFTIFLLGGIVTFGALQSFNYHNSPESTDRILAEELQEKEEILPDVRLVTRLLQRAFETVSVNLPK